MKSANRYMGTESQLDYCPFCRSSQRLTHLEFCSLYQRNEPLPDYEGAETPASGWRLTYPGQGRLVAFVSHPTCGPDVGYAIAISELRKDLAGWEEHLRRKMWSTRSVLDAVEYVTVGRTTIKPEPFVARKAKELPVEVVPANSVPRLKIKTYLIQSELGGHVKIGKSVDPKKRLRSLQTGHAERLILRKVIKGDTEAALHRRFKDLRASGEWFRCEGDLVAFLEQTP